MKVLLILPKGTGRYEKPTIPHAGTAYLAGMLRGHNHEVRIMDMRLYPEYKLLSKKIKQFKPELIGVTTLSRGYGIAYSLISRIKRDFNVPVVIGGAHASTIKEKILEECEVDYAVIGEGEFTLLELAEEHSPQKILGLCWRKHGRIIKNPLRPFNHDLDKLPYPAYDLFEIDKFLERTIPIVSSRGCPFQCTFCSVRLVMGQGFRYRSPENVVGEIEYWVKKGFNDFAFSDDNFTCIKSRVEEICDLIIKKNLKINFTLGNGIRADRVDENLLKKLKKAGCVYIGYGIESINHHVLKEVKKHETPEIIENAIRMTNKTGIKIQGTFIIGLPKSSFKTFLEDLQFSRKLGITNVRFYNLVPYPGTEAFEWIKQHGKFLLDPETYLNRADYWDEEPVFETTEFSREERIKAYRMGLMNYMDIFLKEKFGRYLGSAIFTLYKNDYVRKNFLRTGINLYTTYKHFTKSWNV